MNIKNALSFAAKRMLTRIPEEDRHEFIPEMLRDNLSRISGVSVLLFCVEAVLYFFQETYFHSGYVILWFLASNVVLIPAIWFMKSRVRSATLAIGLVIQYAYCLSTLVLGLMLALVAQPEYDLIHVYLMAVIGVAAFVNMRPWRSAALLGSVFIAFWFLLPAFQTNLTLRITGRVNALIFNLFGFIINQMMFRAKYAAYRSRKALNLRNTELRDLARKDGMTGLANHEECIRALRREMRRAAETSMPLSLILADIDNFKEINDKHGHLCGDEVIRRVAAALHGSMRDSDIVGRYGGEEFLIILPGVPLDGAHALSARLSAAIRQIETDSVCVTISGGICEYHGEPLEALIGAADAKLYRAKSCGKNHFVSR